MNENGGGGLGSDEYMLLHCIIGIDGARMRNLAGLRLSFTTYIPTSQFGIPYCATMYRTSDQTILQDGPGCHCQSVILTTH